MKIRRGKDIKLRWSVTVNDRPITADDDLTLVLINPRLEKIKLDYFIEDGALVFYFRGKDQKFLGEYKLTLWLNYGKENQTALDDTSCFTLVRFTDDEDNDLEDITEVELKGTVTISGDSAFEIWLKNGNTGTQQDFLESLKGKDGVNGVDGKDGVDANSAIEVVNQETNSAAQKGTINVKSTGINSIAGGIKSYAKGNYSLAFGRHNIAEGRGSIAIGGTVSNKKFTGKGGATTYTTDIDYYYLDVVNSGLYVWDSLEGDDKEPAKTVSAIVDEETNKLIVTLDRTLSDTDITDKAYAVTYNHATGSSAIAMGGKAVGNSATCLGTFNYAKGTCATAIGNGNSIDGQSGLVLGAENKAIGNYTYSIGRANYNGSPFNFTVGYKNTAVGDYSMAFGNWGNARDKGVHFASGVSSFFVSPTDTPCKFILHYSSNINHNKFISSLKNSYFIKLTKPNQTSTEDKCITITNAEFIDGTYYIYTEKEVKGITDRTNVGIVFPSIGQGSLVFGKGAAVKPYSVTFGEYNIANATPSFAAGYKNVVEGDASIGLGMFLNTKNDGEVAVGRCNKSNTGADLSTTTLFSIGNGDKDRDPLDEYGWVDMGNGSNAFEVMRNGDIYLGGYGDGYKLYDGVNKELNITPTTITNGTGANSSLQINAYNCEASGINSIATGVKSIASGNYSVAMGRYNEAKGRGSVAIGGTTKGYLFTGVANAVTYVTDIPTEYVNMVNNCRLYKTTESNDSEYWIINNSVLNADNKVEVTLDRTLSTSAVNGVKYYALMNVARGTSAIALGGVVDGNSSVVCGLFNYVNGATSVAMGNENIVTDTCSVAMGLRNTVNGASSNAFGRKNIIEGPNSFASGSENTVKSHSSLAVGWGNTADSMYSYAIGSCAQAKGIGSVAINVYLQNLYLTATDIPKRYILDRSLNIDNNKMSELLQHTKVAEMDYDSSYDLTSITKVELIDDVYYIETERELSGITSHTRITATCNSCLGYNSLSLGSNHVVQGVATGELNTVKDNGITHGGRNYIVGEFSAGYGSHLETKNNNEIALGIANKSNKGTTTAEQTLFSIGNGTVSDWNYDYNNGTNALEIMRNGDIWIGNYNEGKKLWDVATGTSPLVEEMVNKILIEKGVTNG